MKKKLWIGLFIAIVIVGLVGFNVWREVTADAPVVKTTTLTERTLKTTIMTPGTLKLKNEQAVYFSPEKGEVAEIAVKEGDKVKKGATLLRYTSEQLQLEKEQNALAIETSQLRIDSLQKQSNRLNDRERELTQQVGPQEASRVVSEEREQIDLEKRMAELELKQAQLQQDTIEKQLQDLTVKSDVDGTVLTVDEEAAYAANVTEPRPIIRVADLNQLIIEGVISEYDTLKVKNEQPVTLRSDVFPDKEWSGTVSHIGFLPEQSAMGGMDMGADIVQYAVEVSVNDTNMPLKPGFQMIMEIETDSRKAEALPSSAIINESASDGEGALQLTVHKEGDEPTKTSPSNKETEVAYVFVVNDGIVERREVTLGMRSGNWIEIVEGLEPDEHVIVNPPDGLTSGAEVDVQ